MSKTLKAKQVKQVKQAKKYNKKTQYEHILHVPDMYIGSVDRDEIEDVWIWNSEENKMVQKNITITKGLYKIFDEIIVNAEDQEKRSQLGELKIPVTKIIVSIDKETGVISVENNGDGIHIEHDEDEDIYGPELIFGNLLTSENYDKKKKVVGGKNGYGAKLTNIYSKSFRIETIDAERKLKYVQTFTDNMLKKTKPKITENSGTPYTKITFLPDYEKFNMPSGMDDDTFALFQKRVYDVCACTPPTVSVTLNKKLLKIRSFEQYVNLYIGTDKKAYQRVYESPDPRWDVCICSNPSFGNTQHVSFVNGINTFLGGKHVEYISRNVSSALTKLINAKFKKNDTKVRQVHVSNRLWIFVRCDIEDPTFDSQTKECMTTPVKKFGSKCEFSKKFFQSLMNTDLIDKILALTAYSDTTTLSKTDGKKNSTLRGIPKLVDANFAGTGKSQQCILVLTEGDSAKASAVSAISAIPKGADLFGVFPLKGKLLNVRGETLNKVSSNAEITNIKKIIGLQVFEKGNKKLKTYSDTTELRYGKVIILTDQDVDGSHIRGLFMNFIHFYWPSLLDPKIGFVTTIATPIVKTTLTSTANKKTPTIKSFYTLTDYENWKNKCTNISKWNIKYYKGLGTSDAKEAKEFFKDLENKLVTYNRDIKDTSKSLIPEYDGSIATAGKSSTGTGTTKSPSPIKSIESIKSIKSKLVVESEEEPDSEPDSEDSEDSEEEMINFSDDRVCLAFDKTQANRRKVWLSNYDRSNILHQTERVVSLQDFVDKELIHFSSDDNIRSIPSVLDGFKPSQRKVLFGTIKKRIQKEIKVAQLSAFVSEHTCYHHGEVSLSGTIVKMAQNYVGSNNLNLLKPNGQFGTRLQGGKDAASVRYIFTALQEFTRKIYHPDDDPLLNYLDDDGVKIEPTFYVPIIPMILINGATGIGTGFSTNVPLFNPIDIINNIKNRIYGQKYDWIKPWYNGFDGNVEWLSKQNKFTTYGKYEIMSDTVVKITELPIGTWTDNYNETLDKYLDVPKTSKSHTGLISYKKYNTDTSVEIHMRINSDKMQEYMNNPDLFIKTFKLESTKPVQYTNMCLFDKDGHIRRYPDIYAILNEFYKVRLHYYQLRKDYKLKELKHDYDVAQARIRFIEGVVDKTIKVLDIEEDKIVKQLETLEFPKFVKIQYVSEEDNAKLLGIPSYDYLLTMHIRTLTTTKINSLKKDRDEKWAQYEELLLKSPKMIWLDDLDEFVKLYKSFQPDDKTPIKQFSKTLPKSPAPKITIKISSK